MINEDTLLLLDISDISKKYAEKMEYLVEVYYGSEKKVANGCWTCNVVGAETGEVSIIPFTASFIPRKIRILIVPTRRYFRLLM